jgi:modulator of FtsH protease HflC
MIRNKVKVIIGAILLLVFIVLVFVFQVRQSEVAIVTTFRKPTGAPRQPGAHFRLPWPIQEVYKFDERVQSFEDKFVTDLTADGNNLLTQVYVGWSITDPLGFLLKFGSGSPQEAETKVLQDMVRSAKSAVIGKHPLSDFVSASGGSKFSVIEQQILDSLQSQLKSNNYGIAVEFVGIKKLGLPESVTQSVFDRMKREREVLSSDYESQGTAEAEKIRAKADSDAAKILADAERQAKDIRSEGEAYAAQVLPTFQQNPELAKFLLRLDALEASLKERSTLIFDASTPPFDLFNGASTNLLNK